jgi:lipopolysaccharide transport system permease protein
MTARLGELVRYRDLVWNLVVRDLKVRYKSSVLGFVWSLLNPLLMMLVFAMVFGLLFPNQSIPKFPVFLLSGLLPWNFFSTAIMGSIGSIVSNSHLVKKVYFPREVLPISTVLSNGVNFLLALVVLFAMLIFSGKGITVWIVWLPAIILVQVILTLGLAFILTTINVFYRDVTVIMEVVMQAWFFLTPVFYPIEILPETSTLLGLALPVRRLLYIFNPMASIIASYRSVLYGSTTGAPPGPPGFDFFSRTAVTAVLILVVGYLFFSRFAHTFGEEV